ncbi:MAG: tail fiber domain-containing protein [Minisyncoccota bacterium]
MRAFTLSLSLSLSLALALGSFLVLGAPLAVHAALYAPGATLDPACAPTDVSCGVSLSVGSGTTGQVPYYAGAGTSLTATSSLTILLNGNVGIGTASPMYKIDITGNGHFTSFVDALSLIATSSSISSIFNGGFLSNASSTIISGLFSMNGGASTTNLTASGIVNSKNVGDVRFADQFSGSDIGAKVNAAFADFGTSPACGTVEIPTGSYSYSTPITFGSRTGCILKGQGMTNTVLTYTGTGSAVSWTGGFISTMIQIKDFQLSCGAGCTADGIFLQDSFEVEISGMYLSGFPTGHAAVHLNGDGVGGANITAISIHNNYIQTNLGDGVLIDGSGGASAIEIHDNRIQGNGGYGVELNATADMNIQNNVIEGNTLGQILANQILGGSISGNHLENSVGQSTVPLLIGTTGATKGLVIMNNDINGGTAPYCVSLDGGIAHQAITIKSNVCYLASHGYYLNALQGGDIGPNGGDVRDVVYGALTKGVFWNDGVNNTFSFAGGSSATVPTVGIGTTSPFALLSIAASAGATTNLFAISTSTAGFATTTALIVDKNGNLSFLNGAGFTGLTTFTNASSTQFTSTGATYLATLGGDVGVGITNPTHTLEVLGTVRSSQSSVQTTLSSAFSSAPLSVDTTLNPNVGLYIGNASGYTPYLQGASSVSAAMPIYLNPYGGFVAIGGTSASEALTISNGSILLSNNNGIKSLDSGGTSRRMYILTPSNDFQLGMVDGGWGGQLYLKSGNAMTFLVNGSTGTFLTAQTILTNGNIGIGTSSPYSRLTVWGADTSASTSAFTIANSASTTEFQVFDNGNATLAGALTQNSDERLKQDITLLDASSTLAAIESLKPVSFIWRDATKGTDTQLGLIAQDVQRIFPGLVATTSATTLTPGGTLSVNYIGLIAPLVEAVKGLASEIGNLAKSVTTAVVNATTVNTKNLCLTDSTGSTCYTRSELNSLLNRAGQQSVSQVTSPIVITNVSSAPNGSAATTSADVSIPNLNTASSTPDTTASTSPVTNTASTTPPDSSGTTVTGNATTSPDTASTTAASASSH